MNDTSDYSPDTWTVFVADPTAVAKATATLVLGVGSLVLSVLPVCRSMVVSWRRRRIQRSVSSYGYGGYGYGYGHGYGNGSPADNNRVNGDCDDCDDGAVAGSRIAPLFLSFGGGMLLYVSLLRLLPEVRESVARLQADGLLPSGGPVYEYLGAFIFGTGFVAAFLLDELVHHALDFWAGASARSKEEEDRRRWQKQRQREQSWHRSRSLRRRRNVQCIPRPSLENEMPAALKSDMFFETDEDGDGDGGGSAVGARLSVRGLFTVFALSLNELFAGMAVGLARRPADVWYLTEAVATHNLVVAFCVGLELAATNASTALSLLSAFTFAAVSPVGLAVGVLFKPVLADVFRGLAAGTMLYMALFEVFARQAHAAGFFCGSAFAVIGFAAVFLLQTFW